MASFTIVGTGTGTREYIVPAAEAAIQKADVLIGGERNLTPWFQLQDKEYLIIKHPLENTLKFIQENYNQKNIVILVSGDPGFYSLLDYLLKFFSKEEITIIPGISSIQIAFARLSLPWHDATLLNLHGRDISILDKYINLPKIALLTDAKNNPQQICRYLLSQGRINSLVYICSKLGYSDENIISYKLQDNTYDYLIYDKENPNVMVIIDE